ncbi:MAG: sigma 54-interacting transcriptional regulator [Negativicutes bacterium]|nr:sigma 54-interacting transcriptional regulator [Negativicutes bacterium]
MAKILFIIPDENLMPFAREVLQPSYPDIEIVAAISEEGVKIVQNRLAHGLEVVAARAVTAAAIRQAHLNISVVEIPRTSFDIIRALDEAKSSGGKFAFIAYSEKIWGIDLFTAALGISLQQYTVSFKEDFEKEILAARANGAEVILGGFSVVKTARRLGIPCSLIKIGEESLLQAAREAKQIQEALEIETAKRGVFGTILDYSYDGIVTVDSAHKITAFNPAAQKLTKVNRRAALGQPIEKVLPQFDLGKTVDKGRDDLHSIVGVNGARVMCNKVPIIVNGKSFGAVATFQEISKIQQMEALIRQEIYARGHVAKFTFGDVSGESPAIQAAIKTAQHYATTEFNVLILGDTGTGKEVFAQSIHNASDRANGPFVAINCAALPAQILESELFGYVGGAFTGANKEGRPGLFEIAHKGTLLLDEIAEMDYANQGRLLRFLQERTVVRLGSHKVIPVDVRIVAATNKDLETLVHENKFRDDLYYRLNMLNLELPPLKARKGDIRLYAETFLQEFSARSAKNFSLTPEAIEILEEYSWPGNIRELRNIMGRIAVTSQTSVVDGPLLKAVLKLKTLRPSALSPKEERRTQEIQKALHDAKGNYTAAAKLLGIHRMTLRRRMQKLQLDY